MRQLGYVCIPLMTEEDVDTDVVVQHSNPIKIANNVKLFMDDAAEGNHTSKLFVLYFQLLEIMRLFIRAERTGDWNLHLHFIREMLPYFHATLVLGIFYMPNTHI